MNAFHACPGGCHRQVPQEHLSCKDCWYALPLRLRRAIHTSYGIDSDLHADAVADAICWYADNPLDDHEPDPLTRKVDPKTGQTYEWTGSAWRHVTRAELEREQRRQA